MWRSLSLIKENSIERFNAPCKLNPALLLINERSVYPERWVWERKSTPRSMNLMIYDVWSRLEAVRMVWEVFKCLIGNCSLSVVLNLKNILRKSILIAILWIYLNWKMITRLCFTLPSRFVNTNLDLKMFVFIRTRNLMLASSFFTVMKCRITVAVFFNEGKKNKMCFCHASEEAYASLVIK